MKDIYHLDSDSVILDELLTGFRNRNIDQKFIYQGEGAKLYYDDQYSNLIYTSSDTLNEKDFLEFSKKNNLINDTSTAFISLGCGNSGKEKFLFKDIDDKNFCYFGVDSSSSMLEYSKKSLKDYKMSMKFICADFSTKHFRLELNDLTKGYKNKIFSFFSNTFGNIKHTNIIDILSNLLQKGEKIWLDVRLRKDDTIESDFEISNLLAEDLKRDETKKSLNNIIRESGFPIENGELGLDVCKEPSINALKFNYFFLVNKKTSIKIKGDTLFFLPGEKIDIRQIYAYDPIGLINFFNQHGFKLIDQHKKGYRGQFLFEKK